MGKKKGGGATRTDEVRQYLEDFPDAKPKEVVQVLAGRGIEVTPNFVSQIKTRMRSDGGETTTKKATRKARKKAARKEKATGTKAAHTEAPSQAAESATASVGKAAAAVRHGSELSAEDLFEAKRLADELGGIEKARQALDYLERLR